MGLDPKEIGRELMNRRYEKNVREDFLGGVRSGVNGTPTFFIDDVRYDGTPDFDSMAAGLGAGGRNETLA